MTTGFSSGLSHPLDGLAASILDFTDTVERVGSQSGWNFLTDGPATQEWQSEPLAGEWGAQPLQDAYKTGSVLWPVVFDHARALAMLLTAPASTFALLTTARGLAEASSRAWLYLEPEVEPSERVRRLMNDRLYAMFEERKLLRTVAGSDTSWAIEVRDAIHRTGESFGWESHKETRLASGFAPGRPNNTEALTLVLHDRPALAPLFYRMTSAVAHSSLHGITKLLEFSEPTADQPQRVRRAELKSTDAAILTSPAVIAMTRAAGCLALQAGWSTDDLTTATDELTHLWHAVLDIAAETPDLSPFLKALGA
jgi:hypothetical protein